MEKWILNPNEIDFGSGVSTPVTTGAAIPYTVENMVYKDGILQFYASDGWVYDANGNQAGQYGSPGAVFKELAIAPGPGTCDNWCLFWIEISGTTALHFYYQEVIVDVAGNVGLGMNGELSPGSLFGNVAGIAVSPVLIGTDADRDIYLVTFDAVRQYRLSSQGVSILSTFPVNTGGNDFICEADLTHGSNSRLLWGNGNNVFIFDFNSPPIIKSVGSSSSYIYGVEFAPDNQSVYISHSTLGLLNWVPGNDIVQQISESNAYNRTQLELARDGRVYAVRSDGTLGAIQGNSVMQAPYNVIVNSNGLDAIGFQYYALPDQIDGEDYSHFTGVPELVFNDFNINGEVVFDFIDPTHPPLLVFDCAPIELNTSIAGSPGNYSIHIYSTDPANGQQVSGPNFLDETFQGVGTPPSVIDLRCLPDPVDCDLFTDFINPPYNTFAVELTIENRCEKISMLGHIEVQDAPDEAQIGLAVNNTITGIPCPASHDIQAPCLAGIFSASINLANSNGDITFFQLAIDEVDCSSGAVIANIYSGDEVPVSGVGSLTALALNGLEINGQMGYFANTSWLGRCLRVTATVGNPCGESTDFSFLRFNGQYLLVETGMKELSDFETIDNRELREKSGVFPNPFSGEITVSVQLADNSPVNIAIHDASGRLVMVPFKNAELPKGEQNLKLNLGTLAPGMYFVKVKSAFEATTSQIVKIN